jgi:hypothetical protein
MAERRKGSNWSHRPSGTSSDAMAAITRAMECRTRLLGKNHELMVMTSNKK